MSSSATGAGAGRLARGAGEERVERLRAAADGDAELERRRLGRGRQPVRELRLVHEHAGAAVGERIGDLGPLLPDAEGHRHGAEARGAEPSEHELDAVAEQERDPVAGPDAEPGEALRDGGASFEDFRPGQARVAADQRLPVGAPRGRISEERVDAARPFGEAGHDAVAEVRLAALRRAGRAPVGHAARRSGPFAPRSITYSRSNSACA